MLTKKELNALKYAGLLGHEFIVLRQDLTISSECPTIESARKDALEVNGTIYQQVKSRTFKKVK